MKSPKFDTYKEQYERKWTTRETLKQWVVLQPRLPALGITADEYQEITGEPYSD